MSLSTIVETNIQVQGTYNEDFLSQFVEKHRNDFTQQHGNCSIMLFMDKDSSELDIQEWKSFNCLWEQFDATGFNIIGVSTISDVELRKVFRDSNLSDVKFPIIHTDIHLSQTFGCFFTTDKTAFKDRRDMPWTRAKAVATIDDKMELFYLEMRHDACVSQPRQLLHELWGIRKLHQEKQ